jgi:hypothetical protein
MHQKTVNFSRTIKTHAVQAAAAAHTGGTVGSIFASLRLPRQGRQIYDSKITRKHAAYKRNFSFLPIPLKKGRAACKLNASLQVSGGNYDAQFQAHALL